MPQGLLYGYYFPFWKTYFEHLGCEVLVSPSTTKNILDQGVKYSVPEICVPIKVYIGHVLHLIDKDVDYVFVPRFESIEKGKYFCPKFMGLPDLIRHSFDGIEDKMLMPSIKCKSEDISKSKGFKDVAKQLGFSMAKHRKAKKVAQKTWKEFRNLSQKEYLATEAMDIIWNKKRTRA